MPKKKMLAHGTFTWAGSERQFDRYGAVYLGTDAYSVPNVSRSSFDKKAGTRLQGKRVRLTAKVVETRDSGHAGDLFLKIMPSRPEVGEEIDLGVGTIDFGTVDWTTAPTIILKPGDGREVFWLDPRKLYRLHDQTVDLFVEETTDDFSPRPDVGNKVDPDATLSTGDGYMQFKGKAPTMAYPQVEPLGGGLFAVVIPGHGPAGSRVRVDDEDL